MPDGCAIGLVCPLGGFFFNYWIAISWVICCGCIRVVSEKMRCRWCTCSALFCKMHVSGERKVGGFFERGPKSNSYMREVRRLETGHCSKKSVVSLYLAEACIFQSNGEYVVFSYNFI